MLHICSDETIHHKRSSRRVGHPPRNLAAMDCRKEDFRPENPESRRAEFSFMDETGHSAGQKSNRARKGEAMKYVDSIPKKLTKGRVLVHNQVRPHTMIGSRGFRAWTQKPDKTLVV